jgi:hypothetical protein
MRRGYGPPCAAPVGLRFVAQSVVLEAQICRNTGWTTVLLVQLDAVKFQRPIDRPSTAPRRQKHRLHIMNGVSRADKGIPIPSMCVESFSRLRGNKHSLVGTSYLELSCRRLLATWAYDQEQGLYFQCCSLLLALVGLGSVC